MQAHRTARLRAPAVVGLTCLLAGAGVLVSAEAGAATENATQLLTSAIAATKGASSARVVGIVLQGNQTTSLDLSAATNDHGQGSVTVNGQQIKLIRLGPTVYMSASKKFWSQSVSPTAAQLFAGKWIAGPVTNKDFASLGKFLDYPTLMNQLLGGKPSSVVSAGTTTYRGRKVTVLKNKSGGGSGTVYVAASGQPYILRISQTGGSSNGTITFSAYNVQPNPSAPSGAIDFEQLTNPTTSSPSTTAPIQSTP
jgi:hypothetical protein